MIACLLRGLGSDRHLEAPRDPAGDVTDGHTVVGPPVEPRSGGSSLEREPEEMRSVEPVHSGPSVEPITHVTRNLLVAGDADQGGNKAVIAVAVHRRREA